MWTDCVDIDEKIFKIPGYYGKVRAHPDSDVEDDEDYDQDDDEDFGDDEL